MFSFLAKSGQQALVADCLAGLGLVPTISNYNGKRGAGVMITCPTGKMSKRKIDQHLHANNVPGSVSRANRFPVINMDKGCLSNWNIMDKFGGRTVVRVLNGKMEKGHVENTCSCECCGPVYEFVGD